MSRPEGVPADAEELPGLDFFRGYPAPSKLLPGLTQRAFKLRCPQCSAVQPRNFETQTCACGLTMRLDCTALYVWREPAKETA